MCGGGGGSSRAADLAAQQEAERQARIREGLARVDHMFRRFDDGFYGQREGAFLDYATPQLDRQFQDAREALIYALADAGTLTSSPAASRLSDLERQYSENKLRVADEARAYVSGLRSDVENARQNVTQNVLASADVGLAEQLAGRQAQALSVAPTFSPLAQLFANVTAGLGAARNANEAAAIRERLPPPLFDTGTRRTGSGRVVRA